MIHSMSLFYMVLLLYIVLYCVYMEPFTKSYKKFFWEEVKLSILLICISSLKIIVALPLKLLSNGKQALNFISSEFENVLDHFQQIG